MHPKWQKPHRFNLCIKGVFTEILLNLASILTYHFPTNGCLDTLGFFLHLSRILHFQYPCTALCKEFKGIRKGIMEKSNKALLKTQKIYDSLQIVLACCLIQLRWSHMPYGTFLLFGGSTPIKLLWKKHESTNALGNPSRQNSFKLFVTSFFLFLKQFDLSFKLFLLKEINRSNDRPEMNLVAFSITFLASSFSILGVPWAAALSHFDPDEFKLFPQLSLSFTNLMKSFLMRHRNNLRNID